MIYLMEILKRKRQVNAAWMTGLCQKGKDKKNPVEDCRLLFCLSFMWKAITSMIADSMNEYLEKGKLLTNEKGF